MRRTCRRSWGTWSRTAGCVSISKIPSSATRASRTPARCARHDRLRIRAVRLRAGDVHRPRRHPARLAAAVHAADVAHERHFRHRGRRIDRRHRRRLPAGDPDPRGDRPVRVDDEHRERVSDHRPHAQDVQEAVMHLIGELAAVLATALFIFALYWMNDPKTARRGVFAGVTGMTVAVVATWIQPAIVHHGWIVLAIVAGFVVGVPLSRVPLTAVPQRTALSHAFGGLAAGLVGTAEYFLWLSAHAAELTPFRTSALVAEVILGFLTFTGSLMAAGKLQEVRWIPQRPVTYPGQNFVNIGVLALAVSLGVVLVLYPTAPWSGQLFVVIAALALIFGVLLIIPIGGADMPTVISILNAYPALAAGGEQKVWKQESVEGAAQLLEQARSVVIIPGYGMAVAQAQHKVRELYDQLTKRGVSVKFAIHPVAGRMPGHMNVLLAEANIPYSALVEMDEINPEMPQTDVALVLGANDVVNPAARYNKGTPIYGMPIIDADKAKTVLAVKRSKNPGFAGIDNELYVQDNTWMLFGDAKAVLSDLVKQFGAGGLH